MERAYDNEATINTTISPLTYFLLLYKLTNLKKYRENECVIYFRESKFANIIIDNFCLNFHVFILSLNKFAFMDHLYGAYYQDNQV